MKSTPPESAPVAFEFVETCAGWITFQVRPFAALGIVWATHLDDPFPGLLAWLEEIASGEREARWSIDEEDYVTEFVFLAKPRLPLSGLFTKDRLFAMRYGIEDSPSTSESCVVPREVLLRSAYGAFRDFVTSPLYAPGQWEAPNDKKQEGGWRGTALAALRSPLIEDLLGLREAPEKSAPGRSPGAPSRQGELF